MKTDEGIGLVKLFVVLATANMIGGVVFWIVGGMIVGGM